MADALSKLTQTRSEYDDLSGIWVYNRDAYDNLGGFVDGLHLVRYVRENIEAYNRRREVCHFPNFCKDVSNTLSGHLFKKPATRDFAGNPNLEEFNRSTNQRGDVSLPELMKQVHTRSWVYGYTMVLVDKPSEDTKTKADELENGKPYARIIDPIDMLDWEFDDKGEFLWVKTKETYRTAAGDPLGEHEVVTRYRIWTQEGWSLYEGDNEAPTKEGEYDIGQVPIIMVKHDTSLKYPSIGTSTFTAIVQVAIRLFNAISESVNILRGATFPILTIPSLDMGGQEAASNDETTEKNKAALGTDSIIPYDPESRHQPAFINHDGKTLEAYFTEINSLIKQIFQLARLDFTGGVAQSGVSKAFDFEKTNQALVKKSETLRDAELAILSLVDKWMGGDGEIKDVNISYPTDFNIMDIAQELKNNFDALSLNISELFDKEVRKKASRQFLPTLPDDTQKAIDTEIDAGVKPVDEFDDDLDDEEEV